jgi:HD-GYP domain-containing protein (c-di-GMP phosphodiesterase class II)
MALHIPQQKTYQSFLQIRAGAYGYQEPETESHTRRVADLTVHLARVMDVPEGELLGVHRGAMLHDIGMTNVPEDIVHKPALLTDEEWEVVRLHPVFAGQLLEKASRHTPGILEIPCCHHEMWDGYGYPRGLGAEDIPFSARVFAVADVWDSLTSDRAYRPAWSWLEAMEYIEEQSRKQFDPDVARVFLKGAFRVGIRE